MTTEDGGAAFGFSTIPDPDDATKVKPAGMTLRDYFAAQALAIVPGHHIANANEKVTGWARMAYAIADAMLAERSK